MRDEVREKLIYSRLFYFGFHFLAILVLILTDSEISINIENQEYLNAGIFFSLIFISSYLFLTCGN